MHVFKWIGFADSINGASTTIVDAMRKIDLFLRKSRLFYLSNINPMMIIILVNYADNIEELILEISLIYKKFEARDLS